MKNPTILYVSDKNEGRNFKRETWIKVLFKKGLEDCASNITGTSTVTGTKILDVRF
jgi:hypothetical protein